MQAPSDSQNFLGGVLQALLHCHYCSQCTLWLSETTVSNLCHFTIITKPYHCRYITNHRWYHHSHSCRLCRYRHTVTTITVTTVTVTNVTVTTVITTVTTVTYSPLPPLSALSPHHHCYQALSSLSPVYQSHYCHHCISDDRGEQQCDYSGYRGSSGE